MFHVSVPTPPQRAPVPVRSTGASDAIGGLKPVVSALAAADFVADCTVEGLLHAPELGAILAGGARILMISNEHPEILERLLPAPALKPRVDEGAALLAEASQMRVTSAAGTDLTVDVSQAPAAASWGCTNGPGTIAHWPGGLCLCFPPAGTVNGALVLDAGDVGRQVRGPDAGDDACAEQCPYRRRCIQQRLRRLRGSQPQAAVQWGHASQGADGGGLCRSPTT